MLGIYKLKERSIDRLLLLMRLHTNFMFIVLQQHFKTINIIKRL